MRINNLPVLLIIMGLSIKAYGISQISGHSGNHSFFDEHFIGDSISVLVSGGIYTAIMKAICYKTVAPYHQTPVFCRMFAAESVNFFYLLGSQWPVNNLERWEFINLILVMMASGYIGQTGITPDTWRTAMLMASCCQLAKISANSAARLLLGHNLEDHRDSRRGHAILNGLSTGLLIGSMLVWYLGGLSVALTVSSGIALYSTVYYLTSVDSETFSTSDISDAIALIVAGTVIVVVALAGAGARAGAGAAVGALVGAGARAAAATGARALAGVTAGAGVGLLVIYLTQCMIGRLSAHPSINRISGALALAAAASFPLLVSSWFVSVDRFSSGNIPAHETMKAVYPWNILKEALNRF